MHQSFDIVRQANPLQKTTWTFELHGVAFVLSEYRDQYKIPPSTNWRNRKQYDRVLVANNSIEADQIAIPDDVEAELLELFISKLTVTTWPAYSQKKAGK